MKVRGKLGNTFKTLTEEKKSSRYSERCFNILRWNKKNFEQIPKLNLITYRFILEGILEEALRQKENDTSGKIGSAQKNEKTPKKKKRKEKTMQGNIKSFYYLIFCKMQLTLNWISKNTFKS